MDWTKKARGLWVDGVLVTKEQLSDMDYLIAKGDEFFHRNVQTAYDAGIPCILFYENRPEIWIDAGLNELKWPDSANICLKEIKALVGSRAIHGVMIDMSRTRAENGTALMASWIIRTGQHLINRVWETMRKPLFMYMNRNPLTVPGISSEDVELIRGFLEKNDTSTVRLTSCDNNLLPLAERPLLPYDGGQSWSFWQYASKTTGILFSISSMTVDALHELLGFEVTSPIDPDPDPGTPDLDAATIARIAALETKVNALSANLGALTESMSISGADVREIKSKLKSIKEVL